MLASRDQVLFNPGPVNLHQSIRDNLFNVELCHRQPEFEALQESVRRRLVEVSGLERGKHRLSLLHGSGTLAVDAALSNLVRGRVLVVNNGVYCQRIATALKIMGEADVHVLEAGIGHPPVLDQLDELMRSLHPEWLAVVHHETMTGLLNPMEEMASLAELHGCRLFVDAVSAFPVHAAPPRADVVCFNSSKCLESLPGVAGVFWAGDLPARPSLGCLDLPAHAEGLPSTPHVQAFVALDIALDLLADEDRAARYKHLAKYIWDVGGQHFEPLLPEQDRSYVLTSFLLNGATSDELMERALKADFVIYQGQLGLRDQIFRVANMGAAISERNIEALFGVLSS